MNIPKKSIDVLILGVNNSGKTTFLSALAFYINSLQKLKPNLANHENFLYLKELINDIENKTLKPKLVEKNNVASCYVFDNENKKHAMNFLDISGIFFENLYLSKNKIILEFFDTLFNNGNKKIVFLISDSVIDNDLEKKYSKNDISQADHFSYFLEFLKENNFYKKIKAICLLVNKWDNKNNETEEEFLRKNYLNFINIAIDYHKYYNFELKLDTFNIGEIKNSKILEINNKDATKIYEWLCNTISFNFTNLITQKIFGKK